MRPKLLVFGLLLITLSNPVISVADETLSNGDGVYVLEPTSLVDGEGNALAELSRGYYLEIEKVEDDRAFVLSPKRGWLATSGLIHADHDGLAALAKRIEKSPRDGSLYLLRAKVALLPHGPTQKAGYAMPPPQLQQAAGDIKRAKQSKANIAIATSLEGSLHLAQADMGSAVKKFTACLETPSLRELLSKGRRGDGLSPTGRSMATVRQAREHSGRPRGCDSHRPVELRGPACPGAVCVGMWETTN